MGNADSADVLVVGAGVVGLSVARALALHGLEVIAIERHKRVGEETSSRNSGVIHSGIYYPTGSAKARLCVRGRELLYAYCAEKGISYQRCGKIILAQEGEVAKLRDLSQRAAANGVGDLTSLDATEVRELEAADPLCCGAPVSQHWHHRRTRVHDRLAWRSGSRGWLVGVRYRVDRRQE